MAVHTMRPRFEGIQVPELLRAGRSEIFEPERQMLRRKRLQNEDRGQDDSGTVRVCSNVSWFAQRQNLARVSSV